MAIYISCNFNNYVWSLPCEYNSMLYILSKYHKNLKLESVIEIQPIKSTYNTTYFVEDSHYYCFNTKKDTLRINKSTCNINYTDTNARIEKYVNKPDESQLIPIFYISFNDEYTLGDEYYYKIYVPNNAKANDVEE